MPRGDGCGLLPCGQELVGVLPAQSELALEFLQIPFLRGGRYGCVRGAHSVHKPVRSELGLFLTHGQVMPNDQVGDNFAFTLELGRLGRKALVLIQRGLDLAADRPQSR